MRHFFRHWRKELVPFFLIIGALAMGFFFFSPWLVLVEIFFGVGIWVFLRDEKNPISMSPESKVWPLFIFLLFLLIASRIFPFFFSPAPLGYDTGIYRSEIWSSFQQLPFYASQIFLGLPLISNIFLMFGGSLDVALGFLTVMGGLLPVLAIVMVAGRLWGKEVGVIVLLLFLFSLIQWKAYEMILLKQLFALALVFLCFWLFQRRSFLVIFVGAFLALLQPLDAFLLVLSGLSFFAYTLVYRFPERRYFAMLFLLGLSGVLFFWWLEPSFWQRAWEIFSTGVFQPQQLEFSLQQGVFLSLSDYGYQSAFLFVLGVLGWLHTLRFSRPTVIHFYLLVLLVWIAFGLFFYQRLLIQLDAVLLCFSAVTVHRLWYVLSSDRLGKISLSLIGVGLMIPSVMTWIRFQPMIEAQELFSIQSFCSELPERTYVAATDSSYGPWLSGYCLKQRVFGPGLFEDNRWSEEEWRSFWSGKKELVQPLLGRYEDTVYFYVGKKQPQVDFDQGLFGWIEGGWWRGGR